MLYDGLTRLGPDGKAHLSIAENYELSDDGKTYTFHLRNANWSNGERVTASHFVDSWKWMLDPKHPSPIASHFYLIENARQAKEGKAPLNKVGIRALDERSLQIKLIHPSPHFLELLSFYNFYPTHLNGSVYNGPFMLKKWKPNQKMILVKNPLYWDEKNVAIEKIEISFIHDANTEFQSFKSGQLDFAGAPTSPSLPNDAIRMMKEKGELHTVQAVANYFYVFNTKAFPFNNRNIRKAFSFTIPREEIVKYVTQGNEAPAYRFVPAADQAPFDPEKGREYLQKGLNELGIALADLPPLSLHYNVSENHHKIAQTVKEYWESRLGVRVSLKNQDWKSHLSLLKKGEFQMGRLSWKGMTRDPENFLILFSEQDHPMNNSGWRDEVYDALLQSANEEKDLKKRKKLLQQAEDRLMDEMPVAPLFFSTISYVKSKRLNGEYVSELGSVDFKWASIDE